MVARMPKQLEEAIEIQAPAEEVYRLTQNYRRRLEWDPFLKSAELLEGATEVGVGMRARCVSRSGWVMITEYVSANPPRSTAVKMTSGPWFLDRFAGSWRFEEIEPSRTRVTFRYSLAVRPGLLAWLLEPVVGRVFAAETRRRLLALKEAVESQSLHGAY